MFDGEKNKKKYLQVWDEILEWLITRLGQKEELTTSEIKHLAEIQEKIQKNSGMIIETDESESESSFEGLIKVLNDNRCK